MTRVMVVAGLVAMAAPVAADTLHTDVSDVRACLPLADGTFLAGTAGGLVHVDGDGGHLATWTAADGLPGTRIESLVAGEDGRSVWVGADHGAARVALEEHGLTIGATVAGRPVRAVAVHGGATYAATHEGGVVVLDGGRARAVAYAPRTPASGQRATSLASHRGALYAGSAAGLHVLRGRRLEPIALAVEGKAPAVTGLLSDGERLWIASPAGLFVREADSAPRRVADGDLRAVATVDGEVVTAGLGDGLRRVDRGRLVPLTGGPSLALAQAVAGRDGAACAGGLDGLWLRGLNAGWRRVALASALPSTDVSALAADGDRVYAATFDRGVVIHEGGGWRPLDDADLDPRVNALLVEPRAAGSRLWVGTAAGLMTVDGGRVARLTRRDGLPGRGVLSLALLRDGRVVAGTTTGAAVVDNGRATPIGPSGATIGNVWAVGQDADGMLWLGTTTGVWRGPAVARDKGEAAAGWQRYSLATGHLTDDWVMAIAPRGRSVWVGSYKGGVVRFDLPAAGAAAPTASPVGDGWINPGGLAWDGDRLVASTQEGLRTLELASGRWTDERGLPGKDVTAFLRAGGVRWIATRRGLVERD